MIQAMLTTPSVQYAQHAPTPSIYATRFSLVYLQGMGWQFATCIVHAAVTPLSWDRGKDGNNDLSKSAILYW